MLCVYMSSQNGQVNTVGLTRWSVQIKARDKGEVPGHSGQCVQLEKAKIIKKLPANCI